MCKHSGTNQILEVDLKYLIQNRKLSEYCKIYYIRLEEYLISSKLNRNMISDIRLDEYDVPGNAHAHAYRKNNIFMQSFAWKSG